MTVTVSQAWDEIKTTETEAAEEDVATLNYLAFTDAGEDEAAVRTAAKAAIPDFYGGLVFTKLDTGRHEESDDVWACIAYYEHPKSEQTKPVLDVGAVRWGIKSGTATTIKRSYSRGLVGEFVDPAYSTAYTFNLTAAEDIVGIKTGQDGKGLEVEGVDYSVGQVEVSVDTTYSTAQVSGGALLTAADAAAQNMVNSALWRGFAAGTLRIVNFDSTERGGTDPEYDISYTMIFSPNLTNISVGGSVPTVTSKTGHQLLDVMYVPKTVNGIVMSVPVRAAVHDWYPTLDFATSLVI